jgi:hypothetical protein
MPFVTSDFLSAFAWSPGKESLLTLLLQLEVQELKPMLVLATSELELENTS